MSDLKESFGLVIGRTAMLLAKTMEKRLTHAGLDVTVKEFSFLNWLSLNDQVIQQDLAEFMKKDKSAILRIIDLMENRGLLLRVNDPSDRRKKIITVTEKGLALLEEARIVEREVVKELQEGLSQSDIETFVKVAFHMQQKVQE